MYNKSVLARVSKVHLENAKKKVWYYEKWVGRHASFPPRRSVDFSLTFLYLKITCNSALQRLMIVPLGVSKKKISVDSASLVVLISIIYSVPVMQTGPSCWLHGVETQVPV